MFLLRRAALRAVSASASITVAAKPRTFTSLSTTAFRSRQQWLSPSVQRRFSSDEARPSEATTTDETVTESPSEPEQQTLAENSSQSTFDSAVSPEAVIPGVPAKKTLYVGNLFYEVDEDKLREEFSRFGNLVKTSLVRDARGLSKGFGYVEFESEEDAASAVVEMNQRVFEGRRMAVQHHVPRERRRDGGSSFSKTPNPPSKTLFIGNMSFEMSDKDLNDLFREIRNVLDVRVAIDRRTGQPRGFAHADFMDETSATKAKQMLEQKEIYGRKLRIDYSSSAASRN